MLKLEMTPENLKEVQQGGFIWRSPEGAMFYNTKHGIVMKTEMNMCVVTNREYELMKNADRRESKRNALYG